MGQKYLQLPNSSWQPAVFLAAIYNPWTVFQIQTEWWPTVKPHSEDAPQDNRLSTFSGISCKETIRPEIFHFYDTVFLNCQLWLSSVFFLLACASCFLFFGGSDCKLLVMQSPLAHFSVSMPYVCPESSGRCPVTGAHCYFGSSMCLSNRVSGFLVLWYSPLGFGLQRNHDGWWPQQPPCEQPPPPNNPLHTFPFLFMRAKMNKRGVQQW